MANNSTMRRVALIIGFVVWASSLAFAGGGDSAKAEALFRQGKTLFDRQEYDSAHKLLEQAAVLDYAPAMNAVGFCYQYGRGVDKDYAKALMWYKRASAEGDGTGAYNAGWIYLNGVGVSKDETEARKWYILAAQRGHEDAQSTLRKAGIKWDARRDASGEKPAVATKEPDAGKSKPKESPKDTGWYDGRWDSTLYNLSQHPHTVAIRVVVEDEKTRLPLQGVRVTLEGKYEDEDRSGKKTEREFELRATTDRRGVAVFGLRWHKTSRHQSGVDDIEKVERLVVRREGYEYQTRPVNLRFLQEDPDESWKKLIMKTEGAKYFVAMPGPKFKGYNDESCRAEVFFDKIRREDYDNAFPAKENTGRDFPTHFTVSNPQVQAGPFMMLPVTIRMERLFDEHRVRIEGAAGRSRPRDDSDSGRRRESSEERRADSGHRRDNDSKSQVTKDEMPPGHLPIEDVKRINSIIDKSMTIEQILAKLGKPAQSWTAPAGNKCYSWQAWENSRWSVLVVVNPEGKVIRIEADN